MRVRAMDSALSARMNFLRGIPVDVGAHIIDLLASEDDDQGMKSVKACALVCRAFLPLCRKHIFHYISINKPYSNSPKLHHAGSLFAANPKLAQWVRKLDLCMLEEDFLSPDFAVTLELFTNLKSLHLWYHGIDKLDWQKLSSPNHTALLRLLHLPGLTSLRLRNIKHFAIADLIPCRNLTHFTVELVEPRSTHVKGIASSESVRDKKAPIRPSIRIHEYTFRFCEAKCLNEILASPEPDGLPVFNFTDLRRFSGECNGEDDLVAAQRLLACAERLESLHLKISAVLDLRGLARKIQPSAIERTLKSASFAMYINDECEDPLAGLCEELEDIRGRGRNVLENLAIHVMVLPDTDCKRGHEWGKLDAVLGRLGWYALRHVSVRVTIWNFMRISTDLMKFTLEMLLETQFVGLSHNQEIDFKFKVEVKEMMQD